MSLTFGASTFGGLKLQRQSEGIKNRRARGPFRAATCLYQLGTGYAVHSDKLYSQTQKGLPKELQQCVALPSSKFSKMAW